VSRLVLVISDLYPSRQSSEGMPRLARLEQWLARGRSVALASGWQQWLLDEFCAGRFAGRSWAQVAATTSVGSVPNAWLATPVHLVAGIDTVRVHPAGLLELDAAEQQALASDFATVFHDSGWVLQATGRRELLLCSAAPHCAHSSDPARWLGADPGQGVATGADARALRRLASELEMWLHEHAVNRARSARGQLTVSGLWLWGGPLEPALAARAVVPEGEAASSIHIYGADLFLEGLGRLAGATSTPLPMPWPAMRAGLPGGDDADAIVLCTLGGAPGRDSLLRLEAELIVPLMRQLRRGDWHALTLLVGDQAVTLRRPGWRVWASLRRSRPWWESLLG
jgi:hypothetical protein